MDNLKLNDTICFYRKKQGLTQEELAQRLGVTNQSVSKWESSQCPVIKAKLEDAHTLYNALNVDDLIQEAFKNREIKMFSARNYVWDNFGD